jgi:endo-1,4-beta-xylanase
MKNRNILLAAVLATALSCSHGPDENKNQTPGLLNKAVYANDFEDGMKGWKPRADARIEISTDFAHSGKNSIRISNRTASFSAPDLDITSLTAAPGVYRMDCWVYIPAKSAVNSIQLTTESIVSGASHYAQILLPTPVEHEKWTQISGTLNRPAGLDGIRIYVEPLDKTGDFYVDDAEITMIAQ